MSNNSQRVIVFLIWAIAFAPSRVRAGSCTSDQVVANPDPYPKPPATTKLFVLSNDYDSGGEPLVVLSVTGASHGTAAVSGDGLSVTYTPTSGDPSPNDAFTYIAATIDGTRASAPAAVTLSNAPPPNSHPGPAVQTTCSPGASSGYECYFVASADDPGNVRQFDWSWGDAGSPVLTNSSNLAYHHYSAAGGASFAAHITATYFSGQRSGSDFLVTLSGPPLQWHVVSVDGLNVWAHIDFYPPSSGSYFYNYYFVFDSTGSPPSSPVLMTPYNACQQCQDYTNLYNAPGTYTIDFEAIDPSGHLTPYHSTKTVTVDNNAPKANFYASTPDFGRTWTLDPSATVDEHPVTGDPLGPNSFAWSFADGTGTTTSRTGSPPAPQTVTHSYTTYGTYNVTLQVTDNAGAVGSITKPLNYQPVPPTAAFVFNCTAGTRVCVFDATTSSYSGTITNYKWSISSRTGTPAFQDAPQKNVSNPFSYTLPYDGAYNVSLTVSDGVRWSPPANRVVNVTTAALPTALNYFTLSPPCRLYDSVNPLASGSMTNIPGTDGGYTCGIPATAKALAAIVRVVSPTGQGFLQVYPTGSTRPSSVVLNFDPSTSPRSNNTIVTLGTNGQMSILPYVSGANGSTIVRIDVTGYFSTDSTLTAQARGPFGFSTLDPCRVIDSRLQAGPMPGGGAVTYVKAIGTCGIPSGASAAALNITAVGPTTPGWLQAYASNLSTAPNVAQLNFPAYTNLANGGVITLGQRSTDDIAMRYGFTSGSSGSTNYVIDTTGYFAWNVTGRYYPVAPCRAVDTRDPAFGYSKPNGIPQGFVIAGNCGVPSGASAVAVNVTAISPSGAGWMTVYPTRNLIPVTSNINFAAGEPALGNMTVVSLGSSPLDVSMWAGIPGGGTVDITMDVVGYFAPPPKPVPLPKGVVVPRPGSQPPEEKAGQDVEPEPAGTDDPPPIGPTSRNDQEPTRNSPVADDQRQGEGR